MSAQARAHVELLLLDALEAARASGRLMGYEVDGHERCLRALVRESTGQTTWITIETYEEHHL